MHKIFILRRGIYFRAENVAWGARRVLPPSMAKICPVMKDALFEAKNTMTPETSSGVPTRPIGCIVLACSRNILYLCEKKKN